MDQLTFEEAANLVVAMLQDPKQALKMKPRKLDKKKGSLGFTGNDAVTVLTEKLGVDSREKAVIIGQKLVKSYHIVHVTNNKLPFNDDDSLYYFLQDTPTIATETISPERVAEAIAKLLSSEPNHTFTIASTTVPLDPPPRVSKVNSPWTVILNSLPMIPVQKPVPQKSSFVLNGPSIETSKHTSCCDLICGHAISTYPNLPEIKGVRHFSREGDPICDRYAVMVSGRATIFAIADGCNWGNRPLESATKAVDGFLKYINSHLRDISNIHEAGHRILRGFCEAHNKIVEGKEDPWEAGTTTLLGGVLLPVSQGASLSPGANSPVVSPFASPLSSPVGSPSPSPPPTSPLSTDGGSGDLGGSLGSSGQPEKWAFVAASVGDCKALLYSQSKRSVIDITKNNRGILLDATDPGGRLGPYLDACGNPDLRNLSLYYYPHAEPDDVLILVSDGVHDNLEPQSLGISPQALLDSEKATSWKDVPPVMMAIDGGIFVTNAAGPYPIYDTFLKAASCEFKTGEIKFVRPPKKATPKRITKRLLAYTEELTANSKYWMEGHPTMRLPDDHQLYPGKMDHASVVTIKVGITEPDMAPYHNLVINPHAKNYKVKLHPYEFIKRVAPADLPPEAKLFLDNKNVFTLEKFLSKDSAPKAPAEVLQLFEAMSLSIQDSRATDPNKVTDILLKNCGFQTGGIEILKNYPLECIVGNKPEKKKASLLLVSNSKNVHMALLHHEEGEHCEYDVVEVAFGVAAQQAKRGITQTSVTVIVVSNYSFSFYLVDTSQRVMDGVAKDPERHLVDVRYFPDKLLKKDGYCVANPVTFSETVQILSSVSQSLQNS